MIVRVRISNRVSKALSGVDHDYAPVVADLADGWTLCARDHLAANPAQLRLIGRRYTYVAQLSGYRLPGDLCSCCQTPCVCRTAQLKDGETPGVLSLIAARGRKAWDGSDREVLRTSVFTSSSSTTASRSRLRCSDLSPSAGITRTASASRRGAG